MSILTSIVHVYSGGKFWCRLSHLVVRVFTEEDEVELIEMF